MNNQEQKENRKRLFPPEPTQPFPGPSRMMETVSLLLGMASVLCCTCFYFSLIFGALAILLALISRGGERRMGERAVVGLTLGSIGLFVTIGTVLLFAGTLVRSYGGWSEFAEAYGKMSDLDTQQIYQNVYENLMGFLSGE